jgi:hypothetical protein
VDFGVKVITNPKSKEGKKRVAQYRSDSGQGWMNYKGPSWFHRDYTQAPYRAKCRAELGKALIDLEHEVLLERKPKAEYWL